MGAPCTACGRENPAGFKFCGNCGAPLTVGEPAQEVRKVVTIVFCRSTALGSRTDPEALRATMRSYYEEMRTILERHGGTVEKFVGDAVMAVFGVPVSHEDDALRAVRAAWEMRTAVPILGLDARIGVNTGEVVAGEGDTLVTGDAVNIAARLEQAAEAGEVLIGPVTQQLVRNAVTAEPVAIPAKGKPEPVAAFRLLAVDLAAPAAARRLDTPLVGRERELAHLREAHESTVRERGCRLFTLLGAAGVGKSRLTAEFLAGVDATVLRGRCLSYGEGITFWPVVEVLKQLGARAAGTLDRLIEGGSSPNELFWSVRTQLEEVARERALIVVFEDIHWGEATFLDLLDHVADLSRGAPILLLCLARPELLDIRPGWGGGKLNATTTLLEPLSADACQQLIDALEAGLETEMRSRVQSAAGGNPLFLEEMVALARESGDVHVPSSIQALLQARLDRLGVDERAVIERGAVEGEIFHGGTVRELAPAGNDVGANLIRLVRKELIRPELPTWEGEDAYRFRHLLIRDAAYDALPKGTRAELHERFATWIARMGELIELDEIVGYHLEQAARYRADLGLESTDLASRAGSRLAEAGRKALGREDLGGATNLLERALELLERGHPERVRTLLRLAEVAQSLGNFSRFDALIGEAELSTDRSMNLRARLMAMHVEFVRNAQAATPKAVALLAEVVPQLDPSDHESHFWAAMTEYFVHWLGSRGGPALVALRSAGEHARRTGDRRLEGWTAIHVGAATAHGPPHVTEMLRIADELNERAGIVPAAGRAALFTRAFVSFYQGRLDEALELWDEFKRHALELGEEMMVLITSQFPAFVNLRARRAEEAISILEPAYAALRERGADSFASTHAAYLARAYRQAGRPEDALRMALQSEEISAVEDVINFAMGRGVQARVHADRGDLDRAEELARDAVAYALITDFPVARGDSYLDLAYVLGRAGRGAEARQEVEKATGEFNTKGDEAGIAGAQSLLATL